MPSKERQERARQALDKVDLDRRARAIGRMSCPAASGSAWRSPARWSTTPRSCSPTSRPATSTRRPATRSWAVFDRLHEGRQHHRPRHARSRHRRLRPSRHPHPRRTGREGRAGGPRSSCSERNHWSSCVVREVRRLFMPTASEVPSIATSLSGACAVERRRIEHDTLAVVRSGRAPESPTAARACRDARGLQRLPPCFPFRRSAPDTSRRAGRRCVDQPQVVRDEQVGQLEALLKIHQQIDHLRLHRNIEGGNRFVGDDQ